MCIRDRRIIAVFPPPEQKQIRLQLASTLRAVVSQRLVRRADLLGRVPAVEVMIATGYIRDCIMNPDKTRMIRDAIAAGTSQYGMQTFDQSIYDLYSRGLITLEEALMRASNPDEFRLRVQGAVSYTHLHSRREAVGDSNTENTNPVLPLRPQICVRANRARPDENQRERADEF